MKTSHLGITYGGRLKILRGLPSYPSGFALSLGLHTYHDSSWGTDVQPFGGYVIMYCNGAFHWSARRVKIIPDSSAEAEMAVASRAAKETVSVRLVLVDMGAEVHGPSILAD